MRILPERFRRFFSPNEKRLTFGEHLEELRSCIIRVLGVTVIITVFCLFFQQLWMTVLRQPYDRMTANAETYRAKVEEAYATRQERILQAEEDRRRWGEVMEEVAAAGETIPPAIQAAVAHLKAVQDRLDVEIAQLREDQFKIRTIKPTAVFIAYLKVSFIAALFFASPYILFELWWFIGAGLYPAERRYVLTFLPLSALLFIVGLLFGYFILVPIGLSFLANYGGPEILNAFTLDHYLSLCITLTLLLGVVFELPLLMIFTCRIGVATPEGFARYRKYSLLFAVVAAAFLTPPDPATQLLMAGPLVFLYETGIWLSRIFGRPKEV